MPIDAFWIAIGGGAVAVLIGISIAAGRLRRRSDDTAAPDGSEPEPIVTGVGVSPGEQEAAWAAGIAASLLAASRGDTTALRRHLDDSERRSVLLEGELDDLRQAVADADTEVASLRLQLDAAENRVASLETEVAVRGVSASDGGEGMDVAGIEAELAALRDTVAHHAAIERDLRHRLDAAESVAALSTESSADIQAELEVLTERPSESLDDEARLLREQVVELAARLQAAQRDEERVRSESEAAREEAKRARAALEQVRDEADRRVTAAAAEVARAAAKLTEVERAAKETDRDTARLVVRDAEIADLEARLAALSAARDSELRRLNDKIGSMERLYVEVEARERRIEQLEDEVKALAEARDDAVAELARTERELVSVQGAHAATVASLDRLAGLETALTEARTRIAELERHDESEALRAEIERLRKTLVTERERSARMQRRLSLETSQDRPAAAAPSYAEWDRRLRERVDSAVGAAVAPLQERIARLRSVVEEKERRIAALTAVDTPTGPDDLTRIRGIGPKIEEILHGLGITTFREIADFSDDDVARVGELLPVYGRRILDDRWIEQARDLAG